MDVPKPVLNQDELLDAYHDAEGCLWFSLSRRDSGGLLVGVGDRPHPVDPSSFPPSPVGCTPWMPPPGKGGI